MQKSRVTEWVHLCERWCEPDWVYWCDGSADEGARMASQGESEILTLFAEDASMTPLAAITQLALECRGSLRGRTMFVVAYLREGEQAGVLVTDSMPQAALLCRTARVGSDALASLDDGREFTAALYLSGKDRGSQRLISCRLNGPAVEETVCRTAGHGKERVSLRMEQHPELGAGGASCLACKRLCPNRARAIADAAGQSETRTHHPLRQ